MVALNLPVNSLSFGQTSVALLREVYKSGLSPCVFNIGNVDVTAQKEDADFNMWLQGCMNKTLKLHSRDNPIVKLWHINGGMDSYSKNQTLFTFHETDALTDEEVNILNNQNKIIVTSQYTKSVFESCGVTREVVYAPLGFDSANYFNTHKQYLDKEIIQFQLIGKMEERKNTLRIIRLWNKKFGNNSKYRLNCLIFNPFIDIKQQEAMVSNALDNKRVWNIQFFSFLKTNAEVNDFMNSNQIDLSGLSSLEGFNLPLFHSLGLGLWPVVLNAHVHKDYCNNENSVLIEPSAKKVAEDGVFFHRNSKFNCGNWFDFNDDEAVSAMEKAVTLCQKTNENGKKLKDNFTYAKLWKTIVSKVSE